VLAAAAAAFVWYAKIMDQTLGEPERHVLTSFLAATVFVGLFERRGGYRPKRLSSLHWQLSHVAISWSLTVGALLLVIFLSKTSEIYSRAWLLAWIITVPTLVLIGRSVLYVTALRSGFLARNVAIVGAGDEGHRLITRFKQDKSVVIRGLFDDRRSRLPSLVCGLAVRGTTDDLLHFARHEPIDEIIIALPLHAEGRLRSLCNKMKELAVDVRLSLEPLVETFQVRGLSYLGDVPVLEMIDRPLKNWSGAVKLLEDKALGSLLLVFTAPLMLLLAVMIKLDSRGPIFFIQKRFGFNNQVIQVIKFRTMHVDCADPSGAERTLRDDPRVTRLGRILRSLSLDELPQLINVVRGEMSLVGPRPHAILMTTGDRLYREVVAQYPHRHRVKPGITGWAQINGLRGEVDTLEKAHSRVVHDLYYIEHWSPLLDLKILLKTVPLVVARDNAY
jgi:Undecaprenyl-phosphate glucose phosphotransferase